jgi:hypothetical protein
VYDAPSGQNIRDYFNEICLKLNGVVGAIMVSDASGYHRRGDMTRQPHVPNLKGTDDSRHFRVAQDFIRVPNSTSLYDVSALSADDSEYLLYVGSDLALSWQSKRV